MAGKREWKIDLRFVTPIISILTLLGLIYSFMVHTVRWNESTQAVDEIIKKVAVHDEQLAVIQEKLDDISNDVKESRGR